MMYYSRRNSVAAGGGNVSATARDTTMYYSRRNSVAAGGLGSSQHGRRYTCVAVGFLGHTGPVKIQNALVLVICLDR